MSRRNGKRTTRNAKAHTSPKKALAAQPGARSSAVARKGVSTSQDFKRFMSGLMSDIILGKVTPQSANASCNAGGKLLKVVELELKYGRPAAAKAVRVPAPTTLALTE